MNNHPHRKNFVTAAIGAAIATTAALLFLGGDTAQAVAAAEDKLDITVGGFNPQPDPPGNASGTLDPGGEVGIIIINNSENRPGPRVRVGNPDERPSLSPESVLGPHVKTGP